MYSNEGVRPPQSGPVSFSYASLLNMLALILLGAGIVGAISIMNNFGTVTIPGPMLDGTAETVANPLAVYFAVASVGAGIVWAALLGGVAKILTRLDAGN